MDEFLLKLKILIDILEKKQEQLSIVLNITINQQTILLNASNIESRRFFVEMNQAKQLGIDEVIKLDDIFQATFLKIKDELNQKANFYTNEVRKMQVLIKAITDNDVQIRIQEEKNKMLLAGHKNNIVANNTEFIYKHKLLEKYKNNNRKLADVVDGDIIDRTT